jgi:hypothetical protein
VTGGIVGVPDQDTWNTSIQTGGHEEGHSVSDLSVGGIGDDSIANDSKWECEKHQCATELEVVGKKRDENYDIVKI